MARLFVASTMEIRRFFVPTSAIVGNTAYVTGDEYVHMTAVLRFRVGYLAVLCDNSGNDYLCQVQSIDSNQAVLSVQSITRNLTELNYDLTLYTGIIKQDKWEMALQKAVELGVKTIVPFVSCHTVETRIRYDRAARIVLESCKQCGRAVLPTVRPIVSFDAVAAAAADTEMYLAYEHEKSLLLRDALARYHGDGPVALVVGSEGGFTEEEVAMARNCGAHICSLGKRILRAETASIVAVGVVTAFTEQL